MEKSTISKDKSYIHAPTVVDYLQNKSYWAKTRSQEAILKSIENSTCFSLLINNQFAGFARVISDEATFAYLCDVFVLPAFQKRGYGKKLIDFILQDEEFKHLNFYLLTLDAHDFYSQFQFVQDPDLQQRVMRRKAQP